MPGMSTTSESSGGLCVPPDSPGSSVSTRLQDEYDELLRLAVVVPSYDPSTIPRTIHDLRGSFNHPTNTRTVQPRPSPTPDAVPMERTGESSQKPEDISVEGLDNHLADSTLTEDSKAWPHPQPKLADMALGDPLRTQLFMQTHTPGSSEQGSFYDASIGSGEQEYMVTIDQDISRMENLLDQWTGQLKHNILAEFGQAKVKLIGQQKKLAEDERKRFMAEQQKLHSEMDGLRELLSTYENSVIRKDQVISNLTHALQKQREKFELMKSFTEWKITHNDKKAEAVASKLAEKHYERRLQQKCWYAWQSVVESNWKDRIEKACQTKAQEVCMSLTNDYEAKLAAMSRALNAARDEVSRLHEERSRYEETMKKAFMRGVCALNMEAMTMFQDKQKGEEPNEAGPEFPDPGEGLEQSEGPTTAALEAVFLSNPPGAPAPRVVTSQASQHVIVNNRVLTSHSKHMGSSRQQKPRIVTAKITASSSHVGHHGNGVRLSTVTPPMTSVVVEKHHPVVKQTVGHATAKRYVSQNDKGEGGIQPAMEQKIAGQHFHTVRLVE